ncbi:MAG: GAF domain-containing protein [Polyangiales bacterium]
MAPAAIATCSRDGTPNITYLSNVFRLEGDQIALSCQFFNKTKQNVLENPRAVIELYDPVTFEAYRLEVRYHHAEESGPLFDQMALRIDAIASQTGMKGIFRLRSADVYDVVSVEARAGFLDGTELPSLASPDRDRGHDQRPRNELRGLQLVSQRASAARDLDELLKNVLQALDDAFGFSHGMAFVLDEACKKLFVVATHGHPEDSVGAEIAMGEGLVGSVARERKVLRMSGVEAELRYGRAIRAGIQQSSARRGLSPEIPLAGLPDAQSHMAMPLVVGDRLLGVLAVESREQLAFDEWHEAFLEIVGNQVAVAIDNALLREREEEDDEPPPKSEARPPVASAPSKTLKFFAGEDCLFVDGEYLIRNVPARILWRVLRAHVDEGRTEFTNRELRLDPFIGLPAVRDNFESRFVLLRRRLEQKCPELRLISTGRGRFRFETDCRITLEERS